MRLMILGAGVGCLASCSMLTVPGEGKAVGEEREARRILTGAAKAAGNPWVRYQKVEVSYEGEWTEIAKRIQPDLVDGGFRKESVEVYEPRRERVIQVHRGPGGVKRVVRMPRSVTVTYNGELQGAGPKRDASALVADAYTAFLFGASWLASEAESLRRLVPEDLNGGVCERIQGALRPGFGFSEEDHFIAWICGDSGRLRRLQFTIDGLESTRGADVDVTFSEFWKAADGSVWPGRFVERVRRPLNVKAHDWRMTALRLDGRRFR